MTVSCKVTQLSSEDDLKYVKSLICTSEFLKFKIGDENIKHSERPKITENQFRRNRP